MAELDSLMVLDKLTILLSNLMVYSQVFCLFVFQLPKHTHTQTHTLEKTSLKKCFVYLFIKRIIIHKVCSYAVFCTLDEATDNQNVIMLELFPLALIGVIRLTSEVKWPLTNWHCKKIVISPKFTASR